MMKNSLKFWLREEHSIKEAKKLMRIYWWVGIGTEVIFVISSFIFIFRKPSVDFFAIALWSLLVSLTAHILVPLTSINRDTEIIRKYLASPSRKHHTL